MYLKMQHGLHSPTAISERRRLQNRNAQRRFRQRREKQSNHTDNSGSGMAIPLHLCPGEIPSYLTVVESHDNSFCADFDLDHFFATTTTTPSAEGMSESELSPPANQSNSSSPSSSPSSSISLSSSPPSSASTPRFEYSLDNDHSYFMSSKPALSTLSALFIAPMSSMSSPLLPGRCATPTIPQAYIAPVGATCKSPSPSEYEYLGVLHTAAQKGHSRIIHILLGQDKLDCNTPDSEGRTPLMHGVIAGHAAVVRALLAAGARSDAIDHMQRSALHLAVLYRREHILRLLLTEMGSGAGDGHRPLGVVAAGFRCLLDAYDADGNTPMHLAVAGGFEAGVVMLLQSGSNLEVQARRS